MVRSAAATRSGNAKRYRVRVAPVRVAFRRGMDAAAVGAGPARVHRQPAGRPNPAQEARKGGAPWTVEHPAGGGRPAGADSGALR
jgi:hypothetical protein